VSENIDERACELANFIVENKTTVRETAKRFGVSKSTVHIAVTITKGYCG
jgi:putative DeoR family transcriptional regulator (stage III sporulation protein D)